MTLLLGALLAAGVLLAVSPWLWPPREKADRPRRTGAATRLLREAGFRTDARMLVVAVVAGGLVAGAVAWLVTGTAAFALVLTTAGAAVPVMFLRGRRQRLLRLRRGLWPDVCDLLIASIRVGMPLPDAVAALGDAAPAPLRPAFAAFSRDLHATGRFDAAAVTLKEALADPVGDRIVETLRMAREVGGTELSAVLRALSSSVRAEAALARRGRGTAVLDPRGRRARSGGALGGPRPSAAPAGGGAGVHESRRRRADPRGSGGVVRRVPDHAAHRPAARAEAVVPMSDVAIAILLGGLLAAGLLLVLAAFPRWRSASLSTRIAPYLRDVADFADAADRLPWRMPAGGSWSARLKSAFGLFGGGDAGVALRMTQAGLPGRAGAVPQPPAGVGAGRARSRCRGDRRACRWPDGSRPRSCCCPCSGRRSRASAARRCWARRAKARLARLTEELPTVLEFLALCLSAGEGLPDAIRRIGAAGSGELSGELRAVILAVNTGSSLADALGDCARRLQLPALTRATDQIVAALERGAPLAAVLQAQASDAREETKRGLIEQAGRKEILMLLPLVFLILPLSVLFAVFPGVFILRLGLG